VDFEGIWEPEVAPGSRDSQGEKIARPCRKPSKFDILVKSCALLRTIFFMCTSKGSSDFSQEERR